MSGLTAALHVYVVSLVQHRGFRISVELEAVEGGGRSSTLLLIQFSYFLFLLFFWQLVLIGLSTTADKPAACGDSI